MKSIMIGIMLQEQICESVYAIAKGEYRPNYGIVEMHREKNHVRPVAKATDFHIVTA